MVQQRLNIYKLSVLLIIALQEASLGFVLPSRSTHTSCTTCSARFDRTARLVQSVSATEERTSTQLKLVQEESESESESDAKVDSDSEIDRLKVGWSDLVNGRAFDASKASRLLTPEDVIGVVGHGPLIVESLRTAFTGQFSTTGYVFCAATSFITALSHLKMTLDTPRDYRAPRLAEYRSVYEFSALYLIPFSWLLWRITNTFPEQLEVADPIMSALFTIITIYGVAYALYGKGLLNRVNNDPTYEGILEPSSESYQKQAQLYLTGNVTINGLACLFIPFAWTLTARGTEWWDRVQALHPNQAAFMGLSLLVATVGDVSGNLLLRLKELEIVKSQPSIVVMGILSNFWLLLFPEIVFNTIYNSGISEVGFYWE